MMKLQSQHILGITLGMLVIIIALLIMMIIRIERVNQVDSIAGQIGPDGLIVENVSIADMVDETCVGEFCNDLSAMGSSDDVMAVKVALHDLSRKDALGPVGCGSYMKLQEYDVPTSTGVLRATYEQLFSLPRELDGAAENVVADSRLVFEDVSIDDTGHVRVELSGEVYVSHCAIPVLRAQIEQTALQFPTVQSAEFHVNGQLMNWCEDHDGPEATIDCNRDPRWWVVQK